MKLGLDNPRRLLREYLAFPPHRTRVIQVAGTNGKGSTCAFIDSVARATGTRTGLFTSPHLVRFNERIRVSGLEIPDEEVATHLTALRQLVSDWDPHPTFFELTLALGMKYFADRACELVVLETGMGGRLDATTAVPSDVAVLTPVSLDHQQWLGDSLSEIAAEKAAIIRTGKPTFSSPQEASVRTVIEQTANERRSPLEFIEEPLSGYSLGIPGEHQRDNAALALAALHAAGIHLGYETVKAGLGSVTWPGRFERIPPESSGLAAELVLDIAHNPAAARSLAENWTHQFGDRKAQLVFGAVESKDVSSILQSLAPLAGRIVFVPVNSPRGIPPADLPACLPSDHPPVELFDTLSEALKLPWTTPPPWSPDRPSWWGRSRPSWKALSTPTSRQ